MSPQKKKFARQLAKALGDGPGPRAVEAQKARLVAEAHRRRRMRHRWLAAACLTGLAALAAWYLLLH